MNTGVHVCFKVVVFSVYMPNSGIFGSRGRFIPSFPKNFHIVLHSGCINLHSHKQYKKVPFSLHHFQDLLFVDFFFFKLWPFWLVWGNTLLCFDFHLEKHKYFLTRIVPTFSDNCFFFYYAYLFNFWESGKGKITFVV